MDKLYTLKSIGDLKLSADGEAAAFAVRQADEKLDSYQSDIYAYIKGSMKRITYSGKWSNPVWNGESILSICHEKEDRKSLYAIHVKTGDRSYIKTTDFKTLYDIILPDIVLGARTINCRESSSYTLINTFPVYDEQFHFHDDGFQQLVLLNTNTGEETCISPYGFHVALTAYSSKYIAYYGRYLASGIKDQYALFLYDIKSKETMPMDIQGLFISAIDIMDNSLLLAASTIKEGRAIYKMTVPSGAATLFCDPWTGIGSYVAADSARETAKIFAYDNKVKKIYFIATAGAGSQLCSCNLNGEWEIITFGAGTVNALNVKDGHVYYIAAKDRHSQELYKLNEASEARLTTLNTVQESICSEPIVHECINCRSLRLNGSIYIPEEFDRSRKYPAVLMLPGGYRYIYNSAYSVERQHLLKNGFVVLGFTPGGSIGRETILPAAGVKNWTYEIDNILEFTENALSEYDFIDRDRLSIIGYSYGGYLVNHIIGKTDLFSAAVSKSSLSYWSSALAASSNPELFGVGNLTPAMNSNILWEMSPLKNVSAVKTPLLLMHGFDDRFLSYTESLQLFTELKLRGKDTKVILFKNEGHHMYSEGKPSNRITAIIEACAWLKKYID